MSSKHKIDDIVIVAADGYDVFFGRIIQDDTGLLDSHGRLLMVVQIEDDGPRGKRHWPNKNNVVLVPYSSCTGTRLTTTKGINTSFE